jgi:hypothetical protein
MPYSNDGGPVFNATRCSAIARDPAGVGEPCTTAQGPVGGVDDCDAGMMCWDVDPQTNTGHCVAFCTGCEADPACSTPCSYCAFAGGSGLPVVCLPRCNPLAQDCAEGEGCYPVYDGFGCRADASGEDGAAGDPCEFVGACDPGMFCADADALPGCEGSSGCCTPYCELRSADPCPNATPPIECVPLHDAPPTNDCMSHDNVGACMLPG